MRERYSFTCQCGKQAYGGALVCDGCAGRSAQVAALAAENKRLRELLDLHRRFHGKAGCPGGSECYVCAAEWQEQESPR
jgi:hypothetical protein